MDAREAKALWERVAATLGGGPAGEAETPPAGGAAASVAAYVPTFAGVPHAAEAVDLVGTDVAVLGIPYDGGPGAGRGLPGRGQGSVGEVAWAGGGCERAPAEVRRASLDYALVGGCAPRSEGGRDLASPGRARLADYGDVEVVPGDAAATFVSSLERLADIVAAGALPVVLGGDHAVTVPVLQVVAAKLVGRLGLVAFDGLFDLHTSPPYAAGSQWARAFELGILEPDNFVQIGIREGRETALERAVAAELGHPYFTVSDVDELGMGLVAQEALELASRGTEVVYVSVDTCVLDETGAERDAADPGGVTARELLHALRVLARAPLAGLDICGIVPRQDSPGRLARLAARAVVEVVAGVARQRP